MNNRRRVVACIFPGQGSAPLIYAGNPLIALLIPSLTASTKLPAGDMHILAYFNKHNRHARILAYRDKFFSAIRAFSRMSSSISLPTSDCSRDSASSRHDIHPFSSRQHALMLNCSMVSITFPHLFPALNNTLAQY